MFLKTYSGDNLFTIPEHPPLPKNKFQFAIFRGADPEFFSSMKIPLIAGRAFQEAERLENARSAIVSQAFASEFFRGEDSIGKHLRLDAGGGVLFNEAAILVRTHVNPISLALPIQKEIARLDPELAVADILTMHQRIGTSTSAAAFNTALIFGFAMLSLALAAVGLYGVLSYVVTQRTPELGIRLALGAKRAELVRLVLLDGMRPAVIGMEFGLAGGLAAARLVKAMLFGVKPMDISIFVAVPLVLLGVATLACLLPAWRASMLDPIRALRFQ